MTATTDPKETGISPGISGCERGKGANQMVAFILGFHTVLTTSQTALSDETEAQTMVASWWAGPHLNQDSLDVHIPGRYFKFESQLRNTRMGMRQSSWIFVPLPKVASRNKSPLFAFYCQSGYFNCIFRDV